MVGSRDLSLKIIIIQNFLKRLSPHQYFHYLETNLTIISKKINEI